MGNSVAVPQRQPSEDEASHQTPTEVIPTAAATAAAPATDTTVEPAASFSPLATPAAAATAAAAVTAPAISEEEPTQERQKRRAAGNRKSNSDKKNAAANKRARVVNNEESNTQGEEEEEEKEEEREEDGDSQDCLSGFYQKIWLEIFVQQEILRESMKRVGVAPNDNILLAEGLEDLLKDIPANPPDDYDVKTGRKLEKKMGQLLRKNDEFFMTSLHWIPPKKQAEQNAVANKTKSSIKEELRRKWNKNHDFRLYYGLMPTAYYASQSRSMVGNTKVICQRQLDGARCENAFLWDFIVYPRGT